MADASTNELIKDRAKRTCHGLSVSYCKGEIAGVFGQCSFLIQKCSKTDTWRGRGGLSGDGRNRGLNRLGQTEILMDGAVRLSVADLMGVFSGCAVENAHDNQARIGIHEGDGRLIACIAKRAR